MYAFTEPKLLHIKPCLTTLTLFACIERASVYSLLSLPPRSISPLPYTAVVVLGITGGVVWMGGSVVGAGNGASACDSQSGGTGGGGDFASLNIFLTVSSLMWDL